MALDSLISALHAAVFVDSRSDSQLLTVAINTYQSFAWNLVNYKSEDGWSNPLQRFIWLRALRHDGSFMGTADLSPELAKWKYFCHIVTLFEALQVGQHGSPIQ